MDKEDKVISGNAVLPIVEDGQVKPSASSRRKFTRDALVGSAVLLTLGNRSAWGNGLPNGAVCISENIYMSIVGAPAGNIMASHAGTDKHSQALSDYDTYFNDSGYMDQEPPELSDHVCVVPVPE